MKILFLIPYPTEGASNRYRVEQYLPYLKKEGIEYSLSPFWNSAAFALLFKKGEYLKKIAFFVRGILCRIFDIFRLFSYDLVFIHREVFPVGGPLFENILSFFDIPFIYDFDDPVFLYHTTPSNKFMLFFKNPDKVENIIRKSKHVIAGNQYLADYSLPLNSYTSIIPTSIDTKKYFPAYPKNSSKEITIGWIGSTGTSEYLKLLKEPLTSIIKRFTSIKIMIIGGHLNLNGYTQVNCKPWKMDEEKDDLSLFNIGILPTPDDDWAKGKCGFKAIIYMSLEIPVVASNVGMNKEIITDGVNGFLVGNSLDWEKKLTMLIENPELRAKMGANGRKTIEERYSLEVNAPKFIKVLRKVYFDHSTKQAGNRSA